MRTAFLIDGFNLYHSVRDLLAMGTPPPLKWLNVPSLCQTIVRDSTLPREAVVGEIHYFSALAKHREAVDPGIVARHQALLHALDAFGVQTHLGEFKRKAGGGWEEKETDVAIGVMLLELFVRNAADAVILMTGDTDLMPAFRTTKRLFPTSVIGFAFPFRRMNNSLRDVADHHFSIRAHQYPKHQLPNPLVCPDGTEIQCPAEWL